MIKKILGLEPKKTEDGAFSPSPVALVMATSSKTNYDNFDYPQKYSQGKLKVMMICTEERNMTMANGKKFSTGNHPVEMMVPMLHLIKAGFDIDIFTPNGKSAKIEMWAFPDKDEEVKKLFNNYKEKFENPKSLKDFVNHEMEKSEEYIAVFIPGGHGAMLGLPDNLDLKKLIFWANNKNLFMLCICHAPAALLAASIDESKDNFIYKGYKMAAFPDSVDKQTPLIGYLPGNMPWYFGKQLKDLGVEIVNTKADNSCFKDRNLITGASPNAANDFGKLSAKSLLEKVNIDI